jgi:hypothetical protein
MCIYPGHIDGSAYKIGHSHPANPDERHACILYFPSVDEKTV